LEDLEIANIVRVEDSLLGGWNIDRQKGALIEFKLLWERCLLLTLSNHYPYLVISLAARD
jgi:hypothetical protein